MSERLRLKNKCRTCLGQSKGMLTLGMMASTETPLSFEEILKEILHVDIKDDNHEEMPQLICYECSEKLKSSHAFIKQAQKVNEKLYSLLNSTASDDLKLGCLDESEIVIEESLEIKLECVEDDDRIVMELQTEPYNLQLITELQEQSCTTEDALETKKPSSNNNSYLHEERYAVMKSPDSEKYTLEPEDDKSALKIQNLWYNNENQVYTSDQLPTLEKQMNNIRTTNLDSKINQQPRLIEIAPFNDSDVSLEEKNGTNRSSDHEKFLDSMTTNQRKRKKKTIQKQKIDKNKLEDIAVPCQICNKIFKNSKDLSIHLQNAHIPDDQRCACKVCGATFTCLRSMYRHMKTFHEDEYLQSLPPPKEKAHECEKCHRMYATPKSLRSHIKVKHSKSEESNGTANEDGTVKKPKVRPLCPICGSSFCSNLELVIHMRRHTGEKPFKCEQCDKTFVQKNALIIHRRLHTGEKPYKCKICGKAFRVSSKLANHLRSHTDERPYKCSQCERSFKFSKDLNIHNRIHTGERPYSCNVCGNTFTQSNSLKTHRMKLGHLEVSGTA